MLTRVRTIDLGEALEQPARVIGRHADASVSDLEPQAPARLLLIADRNGDAALVRKLDGVAQQIQQHLPKPAAVGAHGRRQGAAQFGAQVQPLLAGVGQDQVDRILQKRLKVEGVWIQLDLSGVQPGEVQHVIDDRQQGLAAHDDAADIAARLLRQPIHALQKAGEANDAGQGRADLVAHIGDELGLGDIGGVGGHPLAPQFVLHLLALGDIPQHGDDADHRGAVVTDKRGAAFQPNPSAALAPDADLTQFVDRPFLQRLHAAPMNRTQVVGMKKDAHILADQIVRPIAELANGRRYIFDHPGGVVAQDHVGRALGQHAITRFTLAQLFQGEFGFGLGALGLLPAKLDLDRGAILFRDAVGQASLRLAHVEMQAYQDKADRSPDKDSDDRCAERGIVIWGS